MKTVIVPIDFSETSLHAAAYAAELLKGHYGVTMLLYHSYSKDDEREELPLDDGEEEDICSKKYIFFLLDGKE